MPAGVGLFRALHWIRQEIELDYRQAKLWDGSSRPIRDREKRNVFSHGQPPPIGAKVLCESNHSKGLTTHFQERAHGQRDDAGSAGTAAGGTGKA